jgi:mannosyltransferase
MVTRPLAAPDDGSVRSDRAEVLADVCTWLLPTLLALLVGAWGLGGASLWTDELATWSAVTRTTPQLWRLLGHVDAVAAPYYLAMHGWVMIAGDSTVALRLPSLLAGTATAGLLALLGRELRSPRAGLLAGVVYALLPGATRMAQEARVYALVACAVTLATLLLVRALQRPTARRWAVYAGALLVVGLLHVLALTLVVAHALTVAELWRRGRRPVGHPESPPPSDRIDAPSWRRELPSGSALSPPRRLPRGAFLGFVVAAGLGVAGTAPLFCLGLGQRSQLDWIPTPSLSDLATLPVALVGSWLVTAVVACACLAPVVAVMWSRWRRADAAFRPRQRLRGLFLADRSARAARSPRRHTPETRLQALSPSAVAAPWALLPPALFFLGGHLTHLWVPRYLFFTLPAGALVAGVALARLRPSAAAGAVVVLGLLGLPVQITLREPAGHEMESRAAARLVTTQWRPGDGLLSRDRSWTGPAALAYYGPRGNPPALPLVATSAVDAGLYTGLRSADPDRALAVIHRVWLIRRDDPATGAPEAPLAPGRDQLDAATTAVLRHSFTPHARWHVQGLTVFLLVRAAE